MLVFKLVGLISKWASVGNNNDRLRVNNLAQIWRSEVSNLSIIKKELGKRIFDAENFYIDDVESLKLKEEVSNFKTKIENWQLTNFSGDLILGYINNEERRIEIRNNCLTRQDEIQ